VYTQYVLPYLANDLAGDTRIQNSTINMGAYESPYDAPVVFSNLTTDGSSTTATTTLTLTFNKDIAGLAASDITLTPNGTGATKGTLTGKGVGVYELTVTGLTASGDITVTVARAGYAIAPASKTAQVFCSVGAIRVSFTGLPQDETITLGTAQTLSWRTNAALTISPLSGFTAYQGYLDGNPLSGKTADGITLYAGDYRLGRHRLTVQATRDGTPYSKTVTFTIVQ
jgi:hypothetical protein